VSDQATLEALLRGAILAVPVAVLFALLVLLAHRARRRRDRIAIAVQSPAAPVLAEQPPREPTAREIAVQMGEISKRIDGELASGNKGALAALYLDLAHHHQKLGDEKSRMSALRSAAGYGSLHGPRAAHAAARLELAEVAYLSGDLTSACEQWQLARTAYLEDGEKELYARVEKRMRDNGCPTDWVLTDF
jgi:hypothetical protein